mgnify:FL=1
MSRRRVLGIGLFGGASLSGLLPGRGLAAAQPGASFSSRRIVVTVRGSGPDVILIPGLASGPSVWSGTVAQVTGYRYHLIHIRGFAGLPPDLNASGALLSPVADEIARYIAAMKLRAPALVGHSMGGTLAMMVALRRNVPVSRVMVVDMLPDGAGMVGGTSAGMGYLAAQLNGYFTGTKAGRLLLADMVRKTPGGEGSDPRVISQALADVATRDLEPSLAQIRCPLHIIYAIPADTRLRAAQAQRFGDAYARATNGHIEGVGPSGHIIMLDQPAAFAASLRKFLGR